MKKDAEMQRRQESWATRWPVVGYAVNLFVIAFCVFVVLAGIGVL